MAQQPNLFELSGGGIHVTYSTTSITGKPLFSYHDGFQLKNFSGDEISVVDTIVGKLVSVFLIRTIDGGSTSFTVLIPNIHLPPTNVAALTTEGITTLHKFSIIGPPLGQTELYTFHRLHGTARFVEF
jgi:hypothetical protein